VVTGLHQHHGGHLTVFSVMFISIVIGLGIDYGIYVLFRYDEEIARGRSVAGLDITASRTGPGVLLGALTAAGTFYSLMLTDFHGVQGSGSSPAPRSSRRSSEC
jgi:predicted RND superfamily exporter protein